MKQIGLLIFITLCSCSSTPYDGRYTLNGETVDYSIEKRQCQIEATERAIESLQGNELGPAWMRTRRKNMLSCMREKGFEWVQE